MTTTRRNGKTPRTKKAGAALTLILAMTVHGRVIGDEYAHCDQGCQHIFQSFHPVGGWHPDSGGVFHWWNPQCFPRCAGPNDYCRKPPPNVCWPGYPPFYFWGPPAVGDPGGPAR
jgi:hypothetical protein